MQKRYATLLCEREDKKYYLDNKESRVGKRKGRRSYQAPRSIAQNQPGKVSIPFSPHIDSKILTFTLMHSPLLPPHSC